MMTILGRELCFTTRTRELREQEQRGETMGRFVVMFVLTALGMGASPASADALYTFSWGSSAFGTFDTGAAATDAGYFLLTSLDFSSIHGNASSIHATSFQAGAAYNPTTGEFINHAFGVTTDNSGNMPAAGSAAGDTATSITPFELNSGFLVISASPANFDFFGDTLSVTAGTAPEPATLALLSLGLAGVGFARRKTR